MSGDQDFGRKALRDLSDQLRVKPGSRVRLPGDLEPAFTAGLRDGAAETMLRQSIEILAEYQERLSAQDTHALLVVLQGMDAAGKDGTIKHVMSGVNPQGVRVHSFKVPSAEELNQDYLRRYAVRLPQRGRIGIFNRSHYEEVLVVRVHPELLEAQHLPPESRGKDVWQHRYREINEWERYLVENGIHIVKLFLNLSREEQRQRFLARIERPEKNWKFTAADVRERSHWDEYQEAFAEVLSNTSTEWAPWFAIPADHKWFAHLAVAAVIAHALVKIHPDYPAVTEQSRREMEAARQELLSEVAVASKPRRKR